MKKNLIILHGWNSKVERWQDLKKKLEKKFNVYLPVLPGFGSSNLAYPFKLKDYAYWLEKYLQKIKVNQPIIVAHSFGARIAIKYLSQKKVSSKLVLINAAGLKQRLGFGKKLIFFIAKAGSLFLSIPPFFVLKKPARFLLYALIREKDYYQADEVLKKTMKNILQEDLKKNLKKIKIPTLILWGSKDKVTPLANALLMAQEIPRAKLIVFKNTGHNLPFKKSKKTAELIYQFCYQ